MEAIFDALIALVFIGVPVVGVLYFLRRKETPSIRLAVADGLFSTILVFIGGIGGVQLLVWKDCLNGCSANSGDAGWAAFIHIILAIPIGIAVFIIRLLQTRAARGGTLITESNGHSVVTETVWNKYKQDLRAPALLLGSYILLFVGFSMGVPSWFLLSMFLLGHLMAIYCATKSLRSSSGKVIKIISGVAIILSVYSLYQSFPAFIKVFSTNETLGVLFTKIAFWFFDFWFLYF